MAVTALQTKRTFNEQYCILTLTISGKLIDSFMCVFVDYQIMIGSINESFARVFHFRRSLIFNLNKKIVWNLLKCEGVALK